MNKFSVYKWLPNGEYKQVSSYVSPEEACKIAKNLISSINNLPKRVIITDEEDYCCFEWIYGKGIIFPKIKNNQFCI